MSDDINYPNKDNFNEGFWRCNYEIKITRQGITFHVNADCEGDAIDYMIDYIESMGWNGLLLDQDDINELICDAIADNREDKYLYLDEYISGGNYGKYLSTHNIMIKQL